MNYLLTVVKMGLSTLLTREGKGGEKEGNEAIDKVGRRDDRDGPRSWADPPIVDTDTHQNTIYGK